MATKCIQLRVLTHLVCLLRHTDEQTSLQRLRAVCQQAARHARGSEPFVVPGEGRCPSTGHPLHPSVVGIMIRGLIDRLVRGGERLTGTRLYAACCAQQALHDARRPRAQPTLTRRLRRHLIALAQGAVAARGLTTPTGWRWAGAELADRDRGQRLWLVRGEYRYHYSRRQGAWWVGAAYLCDVEDGQVWAVRVARHHTTVAGAQAAITPAAVHQARTQGRRVLRQGDVWLVERERGHDHLVHLPRSHHFDPALRTLTHPQHGELQVPFMARAHLTLSVSGAQAD